MPKYSIILPVKNGGEYVKECVNSILAQTVNDFDLLVLDSGSTDNTIAWIHSINDARIKIFASKSSLSIEENWRRILSIPKNEYSTLIGHDDVLKINYLETIDNLIRQYPDASLYQTHFSYIDANGKLIRPCLTMKEVESPADFLKSFLSNQINIMGTGFMFRSVDYDDVGGIPPYPNLLFADFELWFNLTVKNFKATSSKDCFSFRLHQSTSSLSSDMKFHQSFEMFIRFLHKFKEQNIEFSNIIQEKGNEFLLFYCKGIAHRLLRTPRTKRNGLSVKSFVKNCKTYAAWLGFADKFNPDKVPSIVLAIILDSNTFFVSLFLLFKKIYKKPILK